eukprot:COSAG02_NODE_431_length_22447_cov_7.487202_10_plen_1110_part_00
MSGADLQVSLLSSQHTSGNPSHGRESSLSASSGFTVVNEGGRGGTTASIYDDDVTGLAEAHDGKAVEAQDNTLRITSPALLALMGTEIGAQDHDIGFRENGAADVGSGAAARRPMLHCVRVAVAAAAGLGGFLGFALENSELARNGHHWNSRPNDMLTLIAVTSFFSAASAAAAFALVQLADYPSERARSRWFVAFTEVVTFALCLSQAKTLAGWSRPFLHLDCMDTSDWDAGTIGFVVAPLLGSLFCVLGTRHSARFRAAIGKERPGLVGALGAMWLWSAVVGLRIWLFPPPAQVRFYQANGGLVECPTPALHAAAIITVLTAAIATVVAATSAYVAVELVSNSLQCCRCCCRDRTPRQSPQTDGRERADSEPQRRGGAFVGIGALLGAIMTALTVLFSIFSPFEAVTIVLPLWTLIGAAVARALVEVYDVDGTAETSRWLSFTLMVLSFGRRQQKGPGGNEASTQSQFLRRSCSITECHSMACGCITRLPLLRLLFKTAGSYTLWSQLVVFVEIYSLLSVVTYVGVNSAFEASGPKGNAHPAIMDCSKPESTTRGGVRMELDNACVRREAFIAQWNYSAQTFDTVGTSKVAEWIDQSPGRHIDWVSTQTEVQGTLLSSHVQRDCLTAADFACVAVEKTDAFWCYSTVIPTPREHGRTLHTFRRTYGNFSARAGGPHYPSARNCGLKPSDWCAAELLRHQLEPNASCATAIDGDVETVGFGNLDVQLYTGCDTVYNGVQFRESQTGAVLVQLKNPRACLHSNNDNIQYTATTASTGDEFSKSLPLFMFLIAFSTLAVADRILIMDLISSNYLVVLVASLNEAAGQYPFEHYEKMLVKQARKIPMFYFFFIVVPTVLFVTYSILRVQLAQATVDTDNARFVCDVYEPDAISDQPFGSTATATQLCDQVRAGTDQITNYVIAVLATIPAVQLFTPVLAAILLMLLVIEVHSLELEAALDQLRAVSAMPLVETTTIDVPACRVQVALAPFVKVQASLLSTSKRWSSILATEIVLVALLICEPLANPDGGSATPSSSVAAYSLLSNSVNSVAAAFVCLLVLAAGFVTRLNDKIAGVPEALVQEQLLTPVEVDVFCSNYDRLNLGLKVRKLRD